MSCELARRLLPTVLVVRPGQGLRWGEDVIRTGFRSDVHGFAFLNRWLLDHCEQERVRQRLRQAISLLSIFLANPLAWRTIPALQRQLADQVAQALVQPYGLCGGMAFAALDYYRRPDIPFPRGDTLDNLPTHTTPEGARLRDYLWHRLVKSLAANAATFLAWMAFLHYLPDPEAGKQWLGKRTLREWQSLKQHLTAGRPWPIGLVGTTEDPTQNHQVVACACDARADGTQVITVYDPNCPGQERLIEFTFQADRFQVLQEGCDPGLRGPLQGFFCEHYQAKREPPHIAWP